MTDRELMQQALNYLDAPSSKVWAAGTQYKIIQALRARLAQPEEQSVGDLYAHRLAVMLECALLDRPGSWDDAHALLDEYRTALRHYTIAFDKKRVSGFGKD